MRDDRWCQRKLLYHSRKNPKKFDCALHDTAAAMQGLRVRGREPLVGVADLLGILDKYGGRSCAETSLRIYQRSACWPRVY